MSRALPVVLRRIVVAAAALATVLLLTAAAAGAQATIVVSPAGAPAGAVRTLGEAVRRASAGDRIVVRAGTYQEPTIHVDKPLAIIGEGWPVLDGAGKRILVIEADDVTVRGLAFRNITYSDVEDRAAITVMGKRGCTIDGNRFRDVFFGVYLGGASDCRVTGNDIQGNPRSEATSGNGVHLWSSHHVTIAGNTVRGMRDGIYLEFSHFVLAERNLSEGNLRYGLHFMYSDDCRYRENVFRRNGAGVAVMYTHRIEMLGNRFEENRKSAAYGLLLKEISDSRLVGNHFTRNSIALMADGANRLDARGNEFVDNGWAVKLMASSWEARFTGNDFLGNSFDVATNSVGNSSTFDGNYWDAYQGYDLDRDGFGDVPFHPVRLFSLIVAQNEPALILLRGTFVSLLDAAERVLPALTPETLVDAHPAMRRLQ